MLRGPRFPQSPGHHSHVVATTTSNILTKQKDEHEHGHGYRFGSGGVGASATGMCSFAHFAVSYVALISGSSGCSTHAGSGDTIDDAAIDRYV